MVAKKTAEQSASGGSRHPGAATDPARGEAGAGRATDRRAPARKASARKTPSRKTAQPKSPEAKSSGLESPGPEPCVAEPPGSKPSGAKSAAQGGTGAAVGRKSTGKKAGAAEAAKQTGATTVVAKKTPGTAAAATTAVPKARVAAAVEPGDLAVRPGEDPWTEEEVAEARAELESEMERLSTEISSSEAALAGLMRDSGDGAGDDQADTGTKNITREHELALAANARETLTQTERALDRLDAGTYGLCENCGNPIGKARMQAFPRATLCVECKQKQERRY
ncbi:TraR/DksA C4-type zinc finger protein [Streptomyces sp. NPDC056160]|uniref:TraR/DksA family transcriptional regulator n=1 Tax=Streptomyces sp. NPDC056160 TaxID=3345731 RepID=UPI0035DBBFD3